MKKTRFILLFIFSMLLFVSCATVKYSPTKRHTHARYQLGTVWHDGCVNTYQKNHTYKVTRKKSHHVRRNF